MITALAWGLGVPGYLLIMALVSRIAFVQMNDDPRNADIDVAPAMLMGLFWPAVLATLPLVAVALGMGWWVTTPARRQVQAHAAAALKQSEEIERRYKTALLEMELYRDHPFTGTP